MGEEPFLRMVYKIGLSYPKFFKMDNLSQLGFLGAEMVLMRSVESPKTMKLPWCMQTEVRVWKQTTFTESLESGIASPAQFVYTLPNIEVGEICIKHKLYEENNFLISHRFDAQQMLNRYQALFDDNAAKTVLIGWTSLIRTMTDSSRLSNTTKCAI